MPYLEIICNNERLGRRKLDEKNGAVVVGRAPDCSLAVRDILLSRRHCKLARQGNDWTIIDLNSKNGTTINGQKLTAAHLLQDRDEVRMGRSRIVFRAEEPSLDEPEMAAPIRAADPNDSLGGTLSGFTLLMPGETEVPENLACPHPRPKAPAAMQSETMQSLLTAIASSSWDSIYAEARRPLQFSGKGKDDTSWKQPGERRVRPRSPIDMSLQASDAPAKVEKKTNPEPKARVEAPGLVRRLPLILGILGIIVWKSMMGSAPATAPVAAPAAVAPVALPAPDVQTIRDAAIFTAVGATAILW